MDRRSISLLGALIVAGCSSSDVSLPATPSGFRGIFLVDGVLLSWNQVPEATGYAVRVTQGTNPPQLFSAFQPSLGLGWNRGVTGLSFTVHALIGVSEGAWSAPIGQPSTFPSFSLRMSADGAHLSWMSPAGPAVIGRGKSVNEIAPVATIEGTSYDDGTLEPGATYYWQVLLGSPPVLLLSEPMKGTAKPPPPSPLSVRYSPYDFVVSWGATAGAASYRLRITDGAGERTTSLDGVEYAAKDCAGAATCTFAVAGVTDAGVMGDFSAPLQVAAPPEMPSTIVPVPGVEKIILTFPTWPRFADRLRIYRRGHQEPDFKEVGIAYPPEFEDGSVVPWGLYEYQASAMNADGVETLVGGIQDRPAFATNAPGPMNAGSGMREEAWSHGQTLTVPSGGYLMGLETAAVSGAPLAPSIVVLSGGVELRRVRALLNGIAGSLNADRVSGTFFDFANANGGPLSVSAGEEIEIRVVAAEGEHVPIDHGVTVATSGSHTRNGSPDPGRDLVFKAFFLPDGGFAPPSAPQARPGIGASRIDWVASPGAASYEVYRQHPAFNGDFVLIGSTQQTWFMDAGAGASSQDLYRVRAVAEDATFSDSLPIIVTSRPDRTAAQNLGDAPASQIEICPAGAAEPGSVVSLEQTLSVGSAGELSALEVAYEFGIGVVRVQVLDASGGTLGTVETRFSRPPFVSPLLPGVPLAPIDLSSLGIAVAQGDSISIRLAATAGCFWLRETGDVYVEGEEIRDGLPAAADLAFRVLVR